MQILENRLDADNPLDLPVNLDDPLESMYILDKSNIY